MKAMLLIHDAESTWAEMAPAEREREMAAYIVYTQALIDAGKFIDGSQLQPSVHARAVTVRGGQVSVADGPYVDTKEQLGGYYMIEVASMDEAVEWAAKCPGARHGGVEVRPIFERG